MRRRRLHRWVFGLAGVYNLGWGAYAAVDPQWLFRFAELPPMRHPAIFACLGMIVGLYGVLYVAVARRPERGALIVAVGLAGKVLGPIGWAVMVARGDWPLSTAALIVPNDLIWWLPFALYLVDVRSVNEQQIARDGLS